MGRRAIAQAIARGATSQRDADLEARIAALEAQVVALKTQVFSKDTKITTNLAP